MQRLPKTHPRMAYYYRRRWQPRRQRWRVRRRRGFYNPRRNYRRRRYTRRNWVRRTARRRRRRRRPRRKHGVVVWNPPRVVRCRIHGWDVGLAGNSTFLSSPLECGVKYQNTTKFGLLGGGVSSRILTLGYFFDRHIHNMNVWSKSNEGFDLAQYRGTKVTLFRHPTISYIFWFLSEFGEIEQTNYQDLHPAKLLLTSRRTLMLSKELGGRKRKRVFIPPPSTSTSKWYSQESWSKVGLAKIGFTPLNLSTSFWHQGQRDLAVWIGYIDPKNSTLVTTPKWKYESWSAATVKTMYRWHWDTGVGNAVLLNPKNLYWGHEVQLTAQLIDRPYYEYFWGYEPRGNSLGGSSLGGDRGNIDNPNIVAIWWYRDDALEVTDNVPRMQRQYCIPDELPTKTQRYWVILSGQPGTSFPNKINPTAQEAANLPTTETVRKILNTLCTTSPFTTHSLDTAPGVTTQPVNIPFFYSSIWKWGGAPFHPGDPINPTQQPTRGADALGVQIHDPTKVAIANLHPWDLDSRGVVTRDCLSRILRSIFTSGSPQLITNREPQKTSKEREDGDEQEPSSDSTDGEECSSAEATEGEEWEEITPQATAQTARQLRRIQRQLKKQHLNRKQLRRRLKAFLSS
nr:ORF1 [Torque teno arctocephalus australis virus 5]